MSLKRMAMKMALAFAAAKGYQAFKGQGGMAGLKQKMSGGGTSGSGGGLGGMLAGLTGGAGGSGGGLGGLLGGLSGGGGAASGGLLGGLAAMAGGSAMAGQGQDAMMARAEEGPADEATAAAMIRAIGQAVRADGQIDADERAALNDIMGDADTPEDRHAIDTALNEPIDPLALAGDVPVGSEAQVYAAALTAIDPDHPAEQAFLADFARGLRLSGETVRDLHAAAGKPV